MRPRTNQQRLAVVGTVSDYLTRTASVLGVLAVLGVISAGSEQSTATAGATSGVPAQVAVQPAAPTR